jgi:hypothetical protein
MRKLYCCFNRTVILFFFLLAGNSEGQDLADLKNQKPFTFHGSVGLNLMAYTVSGIPARQDPFSWVFSANATISFYGIDLPFSIAISDKQKNYSQPFDQFGLSPHWKWITGYIGYRNVTWSQFTLAGHTFVGAGVELTPSILRVGFIYGRFDRKTAYNTTDVVNNAPGYTRLGYAIKLGVGTKDNFFDIIVLRIRDDSNSVKQPDTGTINNPEQNVVTGFNSKFTFTKKLTWETEAAVSIYTTNTGAPPLSDISDDKTLNSLNKFFGINQSSEYNTAIHSSLSFKGKGYTLKLDYKRVDPNYQSLGAYFFNDDLQNITFSPSFSLFKRKVNIAGSIGLQNDNLRKTKKATSNRTIGTLNLSINPIQQFGIDLGYSNYSINQKAGNQPLIDSVKVHTSNHTVLISPMVILTGSSLIHSIIGNYSYTLFRDKNPYTADYTGFNVQTAQLNYILGLIQSKWSFTSGLNWTRMNNTGGINSCYGGTLGVSKSLLNSKMNLSWNNAVTLNTGTGIDTWGFNSNFLCTYAVTSHHNFKLNLYYTGSFADAGAESQHFNEVKGDLSYVFTF